MGKDVKSLQEILEYAIAKEQVARAMYANASEQAENASVRRVLSGLALAEAGHEKALQRLDISQLPEPAPQRATDLRIAEFLEDVTLDAGADLQTVLIYAMKREQKSRDFYQAMAEQYDDPDAKKLFLRLASEEEGHKRTLETIYDDEILAEN